jgi:hypothetical protein
MKVRKMDHRADDSTTIPVKWTVAPIGYKNANAVPKRK